MTRLIFVNRYFHPDTSATSQMLSDLAFALADKGYRVEVITSRLRYEGGASLPSRECIGGVDVRRAWTTRFGRGSILGRAIDYLTFYVSVTAALAWRVRHGDVVVVKTDPPVLTVLATPVVRLRGGKVVNWLQDIFPEVAERLGFGTKLAHALYAPLRLLRNRALKHATVNVAIGERMAAFLAGLGADPARIEVIHNWADGTVIRPVSGVSNPIKREWGLEGKFVVGYSGNLGRAHDVSTLLGAIDRLEKRPAAAVTGDPIGWIFVGGGVNQRALMGEVERRGIKSVIARDYQPRERLAESLGAADVHLVSLRPTLEGLIQPSKIYGIMAAARPAVFIGDADGETARLLARHDCGCTVDEGDSEGLATAILRLAGDESECARLGTNARLAFEANFEKAIAVEKWLRVLDRAANQRPLQSDDGRRN